MILLIDTKGVREMMGMRKTDDYFRKHAYYNAAVHVVAGVGIGILITYPFVGTHPVRFGLVFLAAGLLGHLYPLMKSRM